MAKQESRSKKHTHLIDEKFLLEDAEIAKDYYKTEATVFYKKHFSGYRVPKIIGYV